MSLDKLNNLNIGGLLNNSTISKVSEVDINIIHEDVNNPRKHYDDITQKELCDSIKQIGIISPISLRKHPEIDGDYIINHGHRRFRAAKEAGFSTIPAFLDSNCNEIGQFIENIQREDLSPLDIAQWLSDFKQNNDVKNTEIASYLAKSDSWVSRHLTLLNAPDNIKQAINQGILKSVESAATLIKIAKDHPEQVDTFLTECEGNDVTQKMVRDFAKSLTENENSNDSIIKDTHTIDMFNESNTSPEVEVDDDVDDDFGEFTDTDISSIDTNTTTTTKESNTSPEVDADDVDDDFGEFTDTNSDTTNNNIIHYTEDFNFVDIKGIIEILDIIKLNKEQAEQILGFIDDDDNVSLYDYNYDELRVYLNKITAN